MNTIEHVPPAGDAAISADNLERSPDTGE
jgi:hypothetical protein